MKVEVLYVSKCPSHPPTVKLLKEVLVAEGVHADVTEVLVEDERMARDLNFLGSPTIRINGVDIAGDSLDKGAFACRLYPGSQQAGIPPVEMVRRAVVQARERRTG